MAAIESEIVLKKLCKLPGGPELLRLAESQEDIELVGGAVRDLLLECTPRELDVVVAASAMELAGRLASRLSLDRPPGAPRLLAPIVHDRFGTATVEWPGARVDIAERRIESYPHPGALPEVEPGTVEEDLQRRDFTVNAIAMRLGGAHRGELRAASNALEDLAAKRLRVLHDASFIDDPTRLLRLARYRARLGFEVEEHTARLVRQAVSAHALDTVSGARIGAELRLALAEPDALGALAAMDSLGLLAALHPRLRLDRGSTERALALLPEDGRADLLTMAAVTLPLAMRTGDDDPRVEIVALLDRLEFPAADRDRVATAAVAVPRLMSELPTAPRPSQLRAAVMGIPPEGIALAGGVSETSTEPARRWLTDLRDVRLAITGEDLLAAGVPEGPEIGRRLDVALRMKLDDEIDRPGCDAELRAALEARV